MTASSLGALAGNFRQERPKQGIAAICSAHPLVLRAAIAHAVRAGTTVLIEATCNQVNHLGGYTGMLPADFAALVHAIAAEEGLPRARILLGGDHLGPNPWRKQDAESAMREAEAMVTAYVAAGFTKIHLDASMGCAGEPDGLDDETTAHRAARLAAAAEAAALEHGVTLPVYIIGTEVPPPGGADHALSAIEPTGANAAKTTIDIHRRVFEVAGLSDAFARVIALVVQPGVEFGNENVIVYDRAKAASLSEVLAQAPQFVFEAHSTDYQGRPPLRQLVEDGFSILKVGPELTFALREALYALDLIATDLIEGYGDRPLYHAMEAVMLSEPGDWNRHYGGTPAQKRLQRHYSYSDRIRYYWAKPAAQAAVEQLFKALAGQVVPVTLLRQHMPQRLDLAGQAFDPASVAQAAVERVVEDYHAACHGGDDI